MLLGGWAPENAADLLNTVATPVFYLTDIHLVGKELNCSFRILSPFEFYPLWLQGCNMDRDEKRTFRPSHKQLQVFNILFKLVLYVHEMY